MYQLRIVIRGEQITLIVGSILETCSKCIAKVLRVQFHMKRDICHHEFYMFIKHVFMLKKIREVICLIAFICPSAGILIACNLLHKTIY